MTCNEQSLKEGQETLKLWESITSKPLTSREVIFYRKAFAAGAASRDAEIAELVAALDNSIFVFDLDSKIAKALAKVRKP